MTFGKASFSMNTGQAWAKISDDGTNELQPFMQEALATLNLTGNPPVI
jgi:hypothetical protein